MLHMCPLCSAIYTPKHASKPEAMATQDNESREQWISGCCSTPCWDKHFKEPEEPELAAEAAPSSPARP